MSPEPQNTEADIPAAAWARLREVPDPEIPALSVVDLGIIRFVEPDADGIRVGLSPTYSGCPATDLIAREVRQALESANLGKVDVETVLAPAWSTEDITEEGRAKLKAYGIAPPPRLSKRAEPVRCPQCGSAETETVSEFGSTPCKALRRCLSCREPFEQFKCL